MSLGSCRQGLCEGAAAQRHIHVPSTAARAANPPGSRLQPGAGALECVSVQPLVSADLHPSGHNLLKFCPNGCHQATLLGPFRHNDAVLCGRMSEMATICSPGRVRLTTRQKSTSAGRMQQTWRCNISAPASLQAPSCCPLLSDAESTASICWCRWCFERGHCITPVCWQCKLFLECATGSQQQWQQTHDQQPSHLRITVSRRQYQQYRRQTRLHYEPQPDSQGTPGEADPNPPPAAWL
jgi:hypothetical protein